MKKPAFFYLFTKYFLSVLLLSACVQMRAGVATNLPPADFGTLNLAQLAEVKIVSASKRSEPLQDVPAAVRVVSSEDIARSGATSIPEALRLVPGLNVAQINGTSWAVGARGFQSQYADKLLVMMDGVSVYTPIFSGVFWNEQNYFLPDLDRIEVVLGPGGSIWGANAMNGVINVITKSARDTQGGMVYGGGGNEKLALAGARYGWQLGTNTFARLYAKYNYNDPTRALDGGESYDAASIGQGGFRVDGYPTDSSQWNVKGDVRWSLNDYKSLLPDLTQPPSLTNYSLLREVGGRLSGHWQSEINEDSTLQLQTYFDHSQRHSASVDAEADTGDLEMHHTWSGWRRQVIDWGLDSRVVFLNTGPAWVTFDQAQDTVWLGSGFVQDEINLVPDQLLLTAGIKLEGHSNSGLLPQPNVRLTWHPTERQTFWAAWSQALRSPSEVEMHGQIDLRVINSSTPTELLYSGNPDVDPEELQAWELGWRWESEHHFKLDVNSYYYQYRKLIMATYGAPYSQGSYNVQPVIIANGTAGDSYGGEISLTWQPTENWFATASYSLRHTALHSYLSDPLDFAGDSLTSPQNTVTLSSGLTICRGLKLSGDLRYLDNIPYYNIPAYFEFDAQLTWQPNENWEFALVGQNLLHDHHAEYKASLVDRSAEIERGVYAKVTWKF